MPGNTLRLLSLDGGGVRGLSALMILEQLMETVDPDAPPKPCDYFDMIGGTSTGGLIAVMLGRLKMSVGDAIDAYLSLADRVFQKTAYGVTIQGRIQGRFDSGELTQAVREVIKQQGLQEDALLKDSTEAGCKVFVCATSKETSGIVCLTSYRTPRGNNDLLNSVKIWEACRATSAASSFFDPIAIGRFGEEYVDGATGANNPVWELWNQAQLMWGPEPLEGKVSCLVSIGTGVPVLKSFKNDVLHIGKTLVAIATETEQTAERFRQDKSHLDNTERYYRFNVARGLEDIGLEESKKSKEIAAATRRYVASQEVFKQIRACAGNLTEKKRSQFWTQFSLQGVPTVGKFVDRPTEMAELERVLLPRHDQSQRQKIHVLHGLGGIGKTQLTVEFARRHHDKFSSVFWLDGRSEDSLKRSIASCAGRIPQGQIPKTSRAYTAVDSANVSADVNAVVKDVLGWLADPGNTAWLLIFDNVDREYNPQGGDPDSYDVKLYFSGADHGSVLITSRLATLEQLGDAQKLGKVTKEQGQAIFQNQSTREYVDSERLLKLLHGLPLAIAQAGAYVQQSRVSVATYLRFYEQQWSQLMESGSVTDAPLQDYPGRSVWTTWAISYQAIRKKHEATANLMLLWSFLDNKDLWYGLFAEASQNSVTVEEMLSKWIGDIASNEIEFIGAMQLLRNYSLIEEVQGTKETISYATHPVVHRWAYHYQAKRFESELGQLAVVAVGKAVPHDSARDYWILQRRLLPHAQTCALWLGNSQGSKDFGGNTTYASGSDENVKEQVLLDSIHLLGNLFLDQGKLAEAEQMYERALQGTEKALGPNHTSTLETVHNLGCLYAGQEGKLDKAEQMYKRALQGTEKALGPNHTSTLETVHNLGCLYAGQEGKLDKAEQMYERALQGTEKALGPNHTSTLETVHNLGCLYAGQEGKLDKAEQMYERALQGKEKALGPNHTSTLDTVNNLGCLYAGQEGKIAKAEQMYERALQGYKIASGKESVEQYPRALDTIENMGILYEEQGEYTKARAMYSKALLGRQKAFGPSSYKCRRLESRMDALSTSEPTMETQTQSSSVKESPRTNLPLPPKDFKPRVRHHKSKIPIRSK
ncbi:FabD/lysophospholipase-like protein [Pleomassaria siparia CBS 279.74]|uniref:FabD/lysophospholipase-like protein n=1 Tax=Pleomassaria siparia CBS 279.74 TaxID=1314801 RepID=A0A6G1KFP7_9PLEO|nr:FabD/lysophospholipase-like protein [Pleomassaria siparia CBS 279.74]